MSATHRQLWSLDDETIFVNHGSFGACPIAVLEAQSRWRQQLEAQPMAFFLRQLRPALDAARETLASFVGAPAEQVVFVPNTTIGVSTILNVTSLAAGDELLSTNHAYRACKVALRRFAERAGARSVEVEVPFPLRGGPAEIVERVVDATSERTRLALLDHVTSPTGIVMPIAELVAELTARGIDVIVDGAHAPGMVPLDIAAIAPAYYVGNCHKWLCSPKGAGFIYAREDRLGELWPLPVSYAGDGLAGVERLQDAFAWTGTADPTAYLCVAEAISFLGGLLPGGWPELMETNRRLALQARDLLCNRLAIDSPLPDPMIGALVALPLPAGEGQVDPRTGQDQLYQRLQSEWAIEAPVIPFPAPPQRLLRISCQLYNELDHYGQIAQALAQMLS
ncbi:MAG: aminotransferase class V-fold PLP-dependent enzyme [Deltaproteobacteria bacterium]|nr:aminotransferase class V-fold PLP-dependent enzyme [Deltaproteobacteria bacterium]